MNERLFAADIAALMRSGEEFETSLPDVAHRLAHEFGLPWAAIRLHPIDTTENGRALALRDGRRAIATLLVPRRTPAAVLRLLRERAVPALQGLLAVAIERHEELRDAAARQAA